MKDDVLLVIWNHEDNHDKIWGVARHDGAYVTFWGPRGKSLTFKHQEKYFDYNKKAAPKTRDGYGAVDPEVFEDMIPGFWDDVEQQLVIATLGDKFHGE